MSDDRYIIDGDGDIVDTLDNKVLFPVDICNRLNTDNDIAIEDEIGRRTMEARIAALEAERDELRAKLEKQPKTNDGVQIEHGMVLWIWTTDGTLLMDVEADLGCFIGRGDSGRAITCHAERCYSTRAAAEAARTKGATDGD